MTEQDRHDLVYFWTQKRDVTRWDGWETRKEVIRETNPEIVHAVEQIKMCERILDLAVKNL